MAAGIDKWEHLNQEMRAGQALFTEHSRLLGMTWAVLMQPAQLTRIAEPLVLQIQADELRLRNAGVNLRDQAMAQNLVYFMQREQQLKQPTMPDHMAQLVTAVAGQHPQQTLPPQQVNTEQQQQDATPLKPTDAPAVAEWMDMDVQEKEADQSDVQMDDGNGVHGSGSKGLTEDAEQT